MTTTELEINKELVASTGHISKETDAWLSNDESDGFLSTYLQEYGHRIYITSESEMFKQELQKLWDIGRGELAELMALAKSHDCKWLVLDCDGPKVPGRPTFEW